MACGFSVLDRRSSSAATVRPDASSSSPGHPPRARRRGCRSGRSRTRTCRRPCRGRRAGGSRGTTVRVSQARCRTVTERAAGPSSRPASRWVAQPDAPHSCAPRSSFAPAGPASTSAATATSTSFLICRLLRESCSLIRRETQNLTGMVGACSSRRSSRRTTSAGSTRRRSTRTAATRRPGFVEQFEPKRIAVGRDMRLSSPRWRRPCGKAPPTPAPRCSISGWSGRRWSISRSASSGSTAASRSPHRTTRRSTRA